MPSSLKSLLALLPTLALAAPEPIPGLYNTGIGDGGSPLPATATDPHYQLVDSADPSNTGPDTFVLPDGFPIPPWIANTSTSQWIAPDADQSPGSSQGDYTYRLTFDLNGFQPATATISGQWSSDNTGLQIRLNESDTGQSQGGGFGELHPFSIDSGFQPGTNTLDFVVNNAGDGANPTGLRVELSGTAEPELPPGIAPAITTEPQPATAVVGTTVTFEVTATGSLPLSYSWRKNSIPIPGANTPTLTLPSISPADAAGYTATVSNPWGTDTSVPARLAVTLDLPSPEALTYERPGPSSRRTALAITEIHYHPADRPDALETEFVEIYNSNPWPEPIAGYRLRGQWDYTFPAGTELPALGYLVVAKNPADLTSAYGPVSNLTGGLTASLSNGGGTLRLEKPSAAVLLEITYDDSTPWPAAADGAGASLVLARPSRGENNPHAWTASSDIGGSPGATDPAPVGILHQVRIDRVLSHTPGTDTDSIDLINLSAFPVDLSNARLSTLGTGFSYAIPANTTIAPGATLTFLQSTFGFDLSPTGETVLLTSPDTTRVIHAARTGGQAPDAPWTRTGATTSPVVISEIFYHPPTGDDDDEFIEITNATNNAIDLSGYTFTDGIDFTFPTTSLPASSSLVIAKNRARLLTNHPAIDPDLVLGNYAGTLSNGGERVALSRPVTDLETGDATSVLTLVDEVTYIDGGSWGEWSDGGGSSLELTSVHSDNRIASNWRDSDESNKSTTFTTIGHTAPLNDGKGTADQLHILMMGKGEAIIDDVAVTPQGGGNRVANGSFSQNSGWTFQGTHHTTTITGGSLHARASGRGDLAANRIRTNLTSPLGSSGTVTLSARARWVAGHPEILIRPKGGYIETVATLPIPKNLGTPTDPNGSLTPAAPTITDVRHHPILPASNEPVLVTAQLTDASTATLRYRIDPSNSSSTLTMRDDGTNGDLLAGDGTVSALIPGQFRRTLAAFTISASTTTFPTNQEALVLWGDGDYNNTFATYRIWMTQANRDAWAAREKLSNEPSPVTFVYNGDRVVYAAGATYSGSAYTSPGYNSPTGRICGYNVIFPQHELFLGDDEITLDFPIRDTTGQREQLMYWFLDQFGLTNNHRRYVDLWVNGSGQRSRSGSNAIYTDVQQPGADMVKQWFPDATGGHLIKGDYWHEFTDNGSRIDPATAPRFEVYNNPDGTKNTRRYRWIWRPRATGQTANDFSEIFSLVDAFNVSTPDLIPAVGSLVDLENWARSFVCNDLSANWDSFGNPGMKNSFHYKPPGGQWQVMNWDYDVGLGVFNDGVDRPLFQISDPATGRLYSQPAFLRRYWRNLRLALDTFFSPAGIDDVISKKWAAFQSDRIPLRSPYTASGTGLSIPGWITQRRDFLLSQIAPLEGTPFNVTTNDTSTTSPAVQITGTAPIEVFQLAINGVPIPVEWPSVTTWRTTVALTPGTNSLTFTALDPVGAPLTGLSDTVTITLTAGGTDPAHGHIVFNEVMADSATPYVELHNRSTTTAFDLTGWRVNGLALTLPSGTVLPPGGFLILTPDLNAFATTHGWDIPATAYTGNLDPGGERLTLFDTAGATVDTVRYHDGFPWPATSREVSLQLLDPTADNSRPYPWRAAQESAAGPLLPLDATWRYSQTGSLPGLGWDDPGFNDTPWLSGTALFYAGAAGLPGPKNSPLGLGRISYYFRTTFEYSGPAGASLSLSHVLDDGMVAYLNGEEFYRIRIPDGPVGNSTRASAVSTAGLEGPFNIPAPTLVPGTNLLAVEVHQSSPTSTDAAFGLTLEAGGNSIAPATPGTANSGLASLPPAPPVWINEISADTTNPWIELYHAGSTPLDTTGLYLTDNLANLTRWPLTTTLTANSFTLLDLPIPQSGLVALTDGTTVISGIAYTASGSTVGLLPDGGDSPADLLFTPTPGASNLSSPIPPVHITEWLASNDGPHADPADGDLEDWFELFNAGPDTIDLAAFTLTDDLADPNKFTIPDGTTIAPRSYLLVWADDEPSQNAPGTDLHVAFKLSVSGDSIGLFTPGGRPVDTLTFTTQTPGTSQGFAADGTTVIDLPSQSPGTSNTPAPPIPTATVLPNGDVSLTFATIPGLTYQLEASPDLSPGSWQPAAAAITGDGAPAPPSASPPPGDTRRFYRLVITP